MLSTPLSVVFFRQSRLLSASSSRWGVESAPPEEIGSEEASDRLVLTRGVRSDGQTLRWYKETGVKQITRPSGTRWQVLLDNRVLTSPAGGRLNAPSESMAQAIAFEWGAQEKYIKPFTLPIMALLATSIDQVPKTRHFIVGNLLNCFNTDTVCLRVARAQNSVLHALQAAEHQPVVDWFQGLFQIPVDVFDSGEMGLVAQTRQQEQSITTLQWYLHNCSDLMLTGLDVMVASLKSTILAIAVSEGRLTAHQALALSRLEEDLQIRQWGECEGDHDLDKAELKVRMTTASAFLKMIPNNRRIL